MTRAGVMRGQPAINRFGVGRRRCLAIGAGALLAACSSPPVPRDTFYRLGAAATVTPLPGGPIQGTVEVPPFLAEGMLNERAILYRGGANALQQYSYHAWLEPPSAMLQHAFIDALRAAQAFTLVASPEMRLDRDYELQGSVEQWEQAPAQPAASIALQIALRRIRGDQEVLLKTYRVTEPATDDSVAAAIDAFTRGVDKVIASFLADLAAVPKILPAS